MFFGEEWFGVLLAQLRPRRVRLQAQGSARASAPRPRAPGLHTLPQHLNFPRHFPFNHFQKFKARSNKSNGIMILLPASRVVKGRSIFKS